jgi:hypothetical protein
MLPGKSIEIVLQLGAASRFSLWIRLCAGIAVLAYSLVFSTVEQRNIKKLTKE